MPPRVRRSVVAACIAVVALLIGATASAQSTGAPVLDWRVAPGGVGVMMDIDANENVFAVGNSPFRTRKYDRDGNLLWERPYPTPNERALPSWIATDPAGNVFVSAFRIAGVRDPVGWVVLKYNPAGNLLWKRTIPGSIAETIRVETDPAGNAYVVGTLFHGDASGTSTVDAMTVKYAPSGTRLWTRFFNGGPYVDDVPRSIAVSNDGTRVGVVGESNGAFFTAIYDAQGKQIGARVQSDFWEPRDAAFGPQNQLYVGATTWIPGESTNRIAIFKFASSGGLVWIRTFPEGDMAHRVVTDSQGRVIVAGIEQATTGYPYSNWLTLKVSPDGARLWAATYDGTQHNDERPYFMAVGPSDNIYVTGEAGPAPPGSPTRSALQMTTIKYAPGGARRWVLFTEDGGRGVAVRVGTGGAIHLQGLGLMLTARYNDTGP